MTIKALRLLPPLAFARFGSASEPQDNYELKENPDSLAFRQIKPTATLRVAEDGTLTIKPAADSAALSVADVGKMFRDGKHIRPVAPFFEVFAVMDGQDELVPLTIELLESNLLTLSAIQWTIRVENRKVFRRTGDLNDVVKAQAGISSHHRRIQLLGTCPYFADGASIDFGFVQFVRPSRGDPVGGQIRLRFTPGPGKIYGPFGHRPGRSGSDPYVTPVYRGSTWPDFSERNPKKTDEYWPRETLPPSLYANESLTPPWLNGDRALSRGYLDDACDGYIEISVRGSEHLRARARVCAGPPSFIPDVLFLRTLADDLDQVVNGPDAEGLDFETARSRALDMIRRGAEAVRFMNVAVMNGNDVDGRAAAAFDTMPAEEAFGTERPLRPIMSPAIADTAAVLALHQHVYAALKAGAAPWFPRLLRRPDEMGLLTDSGRRKMPALMSGADSFYLAFTYRQIATLEKAASGPAAEVETEPASRPHAVPALSPRNLTAQLCHQAAGNPVNSRPEMAIANCCPGLEVDFRAVWRRLFEGIVLGEHENYVVAGRAADAEGRVLELKGHRLLRVGDKPVIATLKGPSLATSEVTVRSDRNPHGVWTMEWSNCLAQVVRGLRVNGTCEVDCEFTAEPAPDPVPLGTKSVTLRLRVRDFFDEGTAVISEALAEPGELTQGLCSPWQNDLRECSCFYWASSRPDFVNTYVGDGGLSHGDNWMAKARTGEYVPDDYADTRLLNYEDLFKNWEQLQVQIGGKDSAPDLNPPRGSHKS